MRRSLFKYNNLKDIFFVNPRAHYRYPIIVSDKGTMTAVVTDRFADTFTEDSIKEQYFSSKQHENLHEVIDSNIEQVFVLSKISYDPFLLNTSRSRSVLESPVVTSNPKILSPVADANVSNLVVATDTNKIFTEKVLFFPPMEPVLYLPKLEQELESQLKSEPQPEFIENIPLASLEPKFRLLLEKDPVVFEKFAKFFLLELAKVLYFVFKDEFSEKLFMEKIKNCFGLIFDKTSLKKDPLFDKYTCEKQISTVQHILNILFYNKDFSKKSLGDFDMVIDFTDYKTIPISLLIEVVIYSLNIQDNSLVNDINVKFIDHQNPMLQDITNMFKQTESLDQTKQKNSDVFFYRLLCGKNGIQIQKIYRDIKADYKGAATGHITLRPYLTTDRKNAEQYMNDKISFLKQQKILFPQYKSKLDEVIHKLQEKKILLKENNIKQIIVSFNEELLELCLQMTMIEMGINITLAADVGLIKDVEFIQETLPFLVKNVDQCYKIFDPNIFFPRDNKINKTQFENKIEEVIEKMFPENIQGKILDNFYKTIQYHE